MGPEIEVARICILDTTDEGGWIEYMVTVTAEHASLAQLVLEQSPLKRWVVGSNPTWGTRHIRDAGLLRDALQSDKGCQVIARIYP